MTREENFSPPVLHPDVIPEADANIPEESRQEERTEDNMIATQ